MKVAALAMLVSFLVIACGGGGSKVDRTKTFSELTPEEIADLCDELWDLSRSTFSEEEACKLLSIMMLSLGTDEEGCNSLYEMCLTQPREEPECTLTEESAATCDATVGEYLQCSEDSLPQVKAALATLSCASSVQDLEVLNIEVASCTAFDEKCPDL